MKKAVRTKRMSITPFFVSNFNVAGNRALPFVITSPLGFLNLPNVLEPHILLNLLDVPDRRYYFAQSADGERLMITFEPVHSCVYYGL